VELFRHLPPEKISLKQFYKKAQGGGGIKNNSSGIGLVLV
jgi:hypothetical protein